jgi:uncharacterized spore protein YtfJ
MTELNTTEPIEQLFEKINVDAVFGQPIQEGDVTLIPVADVAVGFGFGSGQSPVTEEGGDEDGSAEAEVGSGAGGGAGGKATPRGYIKITPDGVHFESTMDENRVALAGIGMVAWSVFWVAKTIRAFARK